MERNEFILTAIEVAGIQNYIFGSNELKENVGASELVRQATEDAAYEEIKKCGNHNLKTNNTIDESKKIEDGSLDVELFYAAGGTTVIIFRDLDYAKQLVYDLSRKLHDDMPGLPVYAAHRKFDWDDDQVNLALELADLLAQLKADRGRVGPSSPLMGLSVTASCKSTGLPASKPHPDDEATDHNISIKPVISNAVYHKLKRGFDSADHRIKKLFQLGESVNWTKELDEIGQNNAKLREESYIAVVHIDGNSMGKRFIALNKFFQALESSGDVNRSFIKAQRLFSNFVKDVYKRALIATVQYLYRSEDRKQKLGQPFPFRPIVFGGDDITWVCRGELGLPLAYYFLDQLRKETVLGLDSLLKEVFGEGEVPNSGALDGIEFLSYKDNFIPYAAAGVAIVKTHYPFSRAYEMSEALVKSAKSRISAVERKNKPVGAQLTREGFGIDWHFTTTGLQGGLEEIRKREFTCSTSEQQSLEGRPYVFGEKMTGTWRTWENFELARNGFQTGAWFESNNKLKALRESLRNGPVAVHQFHLARRKADLPKIALPEEDIPEIVKGGFIAEDGKARSVYFDAVEVIEQFEELSVVS